MEEFEDGDGAVGDLVQCSTCKRRFFPKVLEKHSKICKKSTAKRRKVFDSSRQRAEGTDIPVLKPLKPKPETPSKPSNWRRKHEDFIATVTAAKALRQAEKNGKPLPPPPPPSHDPDYTQCPYCQRRFNRNAAERHITFCKEQAARMPNKGGKPGDLKKTTSQYKPTATAKKSNTPPVSAVSSASSRLPQRSGLGQSTGIPSGKVSSTGSYRNSPSGIASPPSGSKTRVASSAYGVQRNSPGGTGLKKKTNDYNSDEIQVDNGVKGKFCHSCGSKYPVETAKFCCECGIRRMFI